MIYRFIFSLMIKIALQSKQDFYDQRIEKNTIYIDYLTLLGIININPLFLTPKQLIVNHGKD